MNNELYTKKAKVESELNKENINYTITEDKDEINYEIEYTIAGQSILTVLRIDEGLLNDCHIYFGELEDNNKKEQILELMNNLNDYYRNSKFYLSSDNLLVEQFVYVSNANSFNAELFIEVVFRELVNLQEKDLKQFMKIIWS